MIGLVQGKEGTLLNYENQKIIDVELEKEMKNFLERKNLYLPYIQGEKISLNI